MKKDNFFLEIKNYSIRNLSYLFSKKLLNHVKDLFDLFENKKSIEVDFFSRHEEIENKLNYINMPKWIKAITVGDTIYLLEYGQDVYNNLDEFYMILLHEIVHALIYRKTKDRCPLWLNEGLALILSNQYKSMEFKQFLNSKDDLLSYDNECFYEKCCAKTMKYIYVYGKKQIMSRLLKNKFTY